MAIALATLLATCVVLNRILPKPRVENVSFKLRYFAAHKDEFDTLFIGTSRIQHHISPQLFDRITAEAGHPTHSFNFGIDGMHPPESFYVTEEILKLKPQRLRQVFFEFENIQTEWSRDVRGTRRLSYWHTWKWTSLALHRAVNPRGNNIWIGKLARAFLRRHEIVLHLNVFLRQFANVGQVSDLIETRDVDVAAETQRDIGPHDDGYQLPLPPMPAERVARYTRKLEHERRGGRPQLIDPWAEKSYREFAARFGEFGAHSFFVITPVATQSPLRFRSPPPPPGPVLLFNNAKRYPQLYDPAVRADEGHLTQTSADEFTRLLAQRFLDATR